MKNDKLVKIISTIILILAILGGSICTILNFDKPDNSTPIETTVPSTESTVPEIPEGEPIIRL